MILLLRGLAMPKAYSGDLRERVCRRCGDGRVRDVRPPNAFRGEREFGDKVGAALARQEVSAAPKPRGGSISPLEEFAAEVLALIDEQPDLTLVETVTALRKRRIKTSRSSLWRFLDRHGITLKKKACTLPTGCVRLWRARADVGFESKACVADPRPAGVYRRNGGKHQHGAAQGAGSQRHQGDRRRSAFWIMEDDHLRGGLAPQ